MEVADRRWVDSMASAYDRGLVPAVFRPFAADLAARAAQLAPADVLELAAGTGVLTAELLSRLPAARVVATDASAAMVAVGERRAPRATWRTADATLLPYDDETFDLVVCQFGVMFFPDKEAAFSEARRVLRPGGTVLVNAWGPVAAHDFQAAVVAIGDRMFPGDPPRFMRSVPHHYANVADLLSDLRAGGLDPVAADEVVLQSAAASAADIAAGYCFGTPLGAEIGARGGDLGTAVQAITAEIEARTGPSPTTGSMCAHVVAARR